MKLEKDFNPGQNNTYNEYNINIGTVQNFNPNATTVYNTYYGTSPMQPENAEGESKPAGNLFDRLKEPEENTDITHIRTEILNYVSRVRFFLDDKWKQGYERLWKEILDMQEVEEKIYHIGKQQGTNFNRDLVGNIIYHLSGKGIFKQPYNAAEFKRHLEPDAEDDHSIRKALRKEPDEMICRRLDSCIEVFQL